MRTVQGVLSIVVLLLHVQYAIQNAYTLSEFSQDVAKLSRMVTGVSVAQDLRQGVISEREAVGRLTGLSDIDTLINEDPAALANDIKTALEKVRTEYEGAFRDVGWIQDGILTLQLPFKWSDITKVANRWTDIVNTNFSVPQLDLNQEITNAKSNDWTERNKFENFVNTVENENATFYARIEKIQKDLNSLNALQSTFTLLKNVSVMKTQYHEMQTQSQNIAQKVSTVKDAIGGTNVAQNKLRQLLAKFEHFDAFIGARAIGDIGDGFNEFLGISSKGDKGKNRIKNVLGPLASLQARSFNIDNLSDSLKQARKTEFLLEKISESVDFLTFFTVFSQCTSTIDLGGPLKYDETMYYSGNVTEKLQAYLNIHSQESSPFNRLETILGLSKTINVISNVDSLAYINQHQAAIDKEIKEFVRKVAVYNNFNLPSGSNIKSLNELYDDIRVAKMTEFSKCIGKAVKMLNRAVVVISTVNSTNYDMTTYVNSIQGLGTIVDELRTLKTEKKRVASDSSEKTFANASDVSEKLKKSSVVIQNFENVLSASSDISKIVNNKNAIQSQQIIFSGQIVGWVDETVDALKSILVSVNQVSSLFSTRPSNISDFAQLFTAIGSINFPSIDARQLHSNLTFLSNIPGIEESVQTVGGLDLDLSFASTQLLNSAQAIPDLGTYVDNLIAIPTSVNNPDAIDDPEMASSGSSTLVIIIVVICVVLIIVSIIASILNRRKIQEKWEARKNGKKDEKDIKSQAKKNVDEKIDNSKFEKHGDDVVMMLPTDKAADDFKAIDKDTDEHGTQNDKHVEMTALDITVKDLDPTQKASVKKFKRKITEDEKIRLEDEKMMEIKPLPLKEWSLEQIMATKDLTREELEAAKKQPRKKVVHKGLVGDYDSTVAQILPKDMLPQPASPRPESTQHSLKSQDVTQKSSMGMLVPKNGYIRNNLFIPPTVIDGNTINFPVLRHSMINSDYAKIAGWYDEKKRPGAAMHPMELEFILKIISIAEDSLKDVKGLVRLWVVKEMVITGDIHGNYPALVHSINRAGPDGQFLALGNYVDRGPRSVDVVILLCVHIIMYPNRFCFLRGNHEFAKINKTHGLLEECQSLFGSEKGTELHKRINRLFEQFPVAAVVNDSIFAVHGGIDEALIEEGADLDRLIVKDPKVYINKDPTLYTKLRNVLVNLFWSDPIKAFIVSKGLSYPYFMQNPRKKESRNYNRAAVEAFLKQHNLDLIIRGHEVKPFGFLYEFDRALLTIFSSPNALNKNKAAIAVLNNHNEISMERHTSNNFDLSPDEGTVETA